MYYPVAALVNLSNTHPLRGSWYVGVEKFLDEPLNKVKRTGITNVRLNTNVQLNTNVMRTTINFHFEHHVM